jgi:S-adenosylmethionine/arginine decarboxylase-like enzyme
MNKDQKLLAEKYDRILLKEEDDQPHYHLILRIEAENLPNTNEECTKVINELTSVIGMEIIYGPKSVYLGKPGFEGYSAFAIISTSHISLHIWEKTEPPLMQLDIFSCNSFSKKDIIDYLESKFDIKEIKDIFIDRTSAVKVRD